MKKKQQEDYLIFFIIIILVILVLIKLIQDNNNTTNNLFHLQNKHLKEGFESDNTSYIKFNETVVDNENVNGSKKWENKNLSQCKFKCDEDKKCIGFSRDKIDDNKQGNCYPKTEVVDCHSLRRGDPEQRNYAQSFDTYIKKSHADKDKNINTKCIGDEELTLNKNINISSYIDPNSYICIHTNEIRIIEYKKKNESFYKNCIFTIVPGLEGSGTVSFTIVDDFKEDYYLSADIVNSKLQLVPIEKESSTVNDRSNASFELIDGFADPTLISIRTFSNINENYYVIPEGAHLKELKVVTNPKLMLVTKKQINTRLKKELATFHLLDKNIKSHENFKSENKHKPFINHNNQDIVAKYSLDTMLMTNDNTISDSNKSNNSNKNKSNINESFEDTNRSIHSNIRRFPEKLRNKYFKESFKSKEESNIKVNKEIDVIILVDKEGNKLMIPSYLGNISSETLKTYVNKINRVYKDANTNRVFNSNEINTILITNPDVVSCRIYNYDFLKQGQFGDDKTLYEYENLINNTDMGLKSIDSYDVGELVYMAKNIEIDTSNKNKKELYNEFIRKSAYKNNIELESKRNYKSEIDTSYVNNLIQIHLSNAENKLKNTKFLNYMSIQFNNKKIKSVFNTEQNQTLTDIKQVILEYEIIELINKLNKNNYFQIKSIQIFEHNPKTNLDTKTKNHKKTDYIDNKLKDLEKMHMSDTKNVEFAKFNKNKAQELEAYKDMVFKKERMLDTKRKQLETDLDTLQMNSSNYKLDKLSNEKILMTP
jgi:hypothetical protein